MDQEIWQRLLSLESVDIVKRWFRSIHEGKLNTCRTKAINFSAKQAREYFRNASQAAYSVRPLLTYYGIVSLSNALVLLLSRDGGAEQHSRAHGLSTINWQDQLSRAHRRLTVDVALNLKVRKCDGLFNDLIKLTFNRTYIHLFDQPNYSINYPVPPNGTEISLLDIISRLPDLSSNLVTLSQAQKYSHVQYVDGTGHQDSELVLRAGQLDSLRSSYENRVIDSMKIHYILAPRPGTIYPHLCVQAAAFF